jgi:Flp pilus assembly protein TadD
MTSRLARAISSAKPAAALACLLLAASCGWLPKVTVIDDPLDKSEHLNLGVAYERDGETGLAEREYRLALPLPRAYLALGNLSFQEGETAKAEEYYLQALQRDDDPEAANNLAWLYLLERRQLREARRLARLAVEEARRRGLNDREIWSFQGTLAQIEKALASERTQ